MRNFRDSSIDVFRPSAETYVPSLRLIDFGCAIDMNLFKEGTEFRKVMKAIFNKLRFINSL